MPIGKSLNLPPAEPNPQVEVLFELISKAASEPFCYWHYQSCWRRRSGPLSSLARSRCVGRKSIKMQLLCKEAMNCVACASSAPWMCFLVLHNSFCRHSPSFCSCCIREGLCRNLSLKKPSSTTPRILLRFQLHKPKHFKRILLTWRIRHMCMFFFFQRKVKMFRKLSCTLWLLQ